MRWLVCVMIALAVSGSSVAPVHAQGAATKKDEKKGEEKTFLTKDGWNVAGTYWESTKEKDAPVVVILPGKGENRVKWNPLAQDLVKQQFAVLIVGLRKQGEAKYQGNNPQAKNNTATKLDYEGMIAFDLEAVKKFLYEEHQAKRLNMRRLGLVAGDQATAIAVSYAAADWLKEPWDDAPSLAAKTPRGQDVQSLVLLSPTDTLPGTNITKSMPVLKLGGVSAMIVAAKGVNAEKQSTEKLYQGLGGDKQDAENKRIIKIELDTKLRGSELLKMPVLIDAGKQAPLQALVVGFLNKKLAEPDIAWRDRKSRLE